MSVQQNIKSSSILYGMVFITVLLVAGVIVYFSRSTKKWEISGTYKNTRTLNGPWKFTVGDNMQYARSDYDDSGWETIDLTAPPGARDGDVGLTGYVPGWSARGHSNYSGFAWYRLKVPLDSLTANNLALAAPPAVDDAYQLFINGSFFGSAGKFAGTVPIAYSIQPRMFQLPENVKKEKSISIAFRVWVSSGNQGPDAGGIHIAPVLGETAHVEKKYLFQWSQTIKGYIVEVVLPVMFILLATTMFLLNRRKQIPNCKWFITALVLLALVRLNQAVYFWFQIESRHQANIIATVILRPLMLGSWLMACREWFVLYQPKWLPKTIAILTLLYMVAQLFGLSWVLNSASHTYFQKFGDYIRLLMLVLMLFIIYKGIRKLAANDLLILVALLLLTIALFPKEVSELHVIPGIWFPYGVGVSRGQYFYAAFVFVMYVVLIRKIRKNERPVKQTQ